MRNKTEHPCTHQAVLQIHGIPFCGAHAREQKAYFAMGELTQEGQDLGNEPLAAARRLRGKGEAMHEDQRVSDMVNGVLSRQATARAERTGEPFGYALEVVLKTEAGRQLVELRGGPHRDEKADRWQEELAPERSRERKRARREAQQEESNKVLKEAAWQLFVREEMRELELRKDGQLAGALNRMRGASPIALPAAL